MPLEERIVAVIDQCDVELIRVRRAAAEGMRGHHSADELAVIGVHENTVLHGGILLSGPPPPAGAVQTTKPGISYRASRVSNGVRTSRRARISADAFGHEDPLWGQQPSCAATSSSSRDPAACVAWTNANMAETARVSVAAKSPVLSQ